ncbi:RHS repeat domain-containing protein [Reichenbachiella sp.]|uniref:RHS repeat domain-containing protein n=1 Tax=Reichenbachiella sp. TaxID=2184521 RepID=UPI003298B171
MMKINSDVRSRRRVHRSVLSFAAAMLLWIPYSAAQFSMDDIEAAVLTPSPTAAALGKYGEIPISLSSGLPSVSIPLTVFSAGNIQVPISLSYYSGGLKVDQSPSWVGMGWSLNAGGVITRTVKDRPDEPNQEAYPKNMAMDDFEALYYIDKAEDDDDIHFDSELDTYSFNFLGNTGRFLIDRNGEVNIFPRQNFLIERQVDGSAVQDNHIKITVGDGTVYLFGGPGGTEYSLSTWSGAGCGKNYDTFTETAFYLVKIQRPNGDEVNFEYDLYQHTYDVGVSQTAKDLIQINNVCSGSETTVSNYNTTTCITRNEVKERRLIRIHATGYGEILFERAAHQVVIKDKSGVQGLRKRFDLTLETTANNRVFLTQVTEKDASLSSQKNHTFEYDDKEAFPPLLSYDRDHWGYYNAANNTTLLDGEGHENEFPGHYPFSMYNANREPDLDATKKGTLTKIIYPTGGSTSFDFELNEVVEQKQVHPPATNIYKSIRGNELNEMPEIVAETYQLGTFSYGQTITYSVSSSKFVELPIHDIAWVSVLDKTAGENALSINSQGNSSSSGTFEVEAGHEYMLEISAERGMEINFTFDYYSAGPESKPVVRKIGGLRLKRLINHDLSGKDNIKTYHYGVMDDLTVSSGEIRQQPTYFSKTEQSEQCQDPLYGSGVVGQYQILVYGQLHSSSVRNLFVTNGNHITYRYVNVGHGENFEGGGEQHQFNISVDSPGRLVYGSYFHNQPLSNSSWDNGQEREVIIYKKVNNQNVILSKTTNEYTLDQRELNEANSLVINKRFDIPYHSDYVKVCDNDSTNDVLMNYRCIVDHEHLYRSSLLKGKWICRRDSTVHKWVVDATFPCYGKTSEDTVTVTRSLEATDIMEYYFKNYWSYLSRSTKVDYDENGLNPVTTITDFVYDNPHHLNLSKQLTTNSRGQELVAHTKYPQDYNYPNNSVLDTMVNRNIIAVPIERISTVDGSVVSAQAVQYEHLSADDLFVPKTYYTYDTSVPSVSFTGSPDGETFSMYRPTGNVLQRDEKGNVLSLQKENDLKVSYIWGYQKSRIVAKVMNAAYTDISGFVSAIQTTSNADHDHCMKGISTCKENDLLVALDALRNAPALSEALITTYTYDPAIGLTSETGPDGQINYYEYDDLGRLKLIRDQDGHVRQAFDYHYANLSTQ